MRCLFYVFAICLNFSSSYAKDIENREPECLVGVDSKKFVASFQIIDKDQKIWIINDGSNEKNEINYSWMVEPGLIKNGDFLPVKYAFGVITACTTQNTWNTMASGDPQDQPTCW